MTKTFRNVESDEWYQMLMEDPSSFPFSFVYNGKSLNGFCESEFTLISQRVEHAEDKITTKKCWKLDETLYVSLQCCHYPFYGASDWTVWFENPSKRNSGVLSEVASSLSFQGSYPVVKGIWGDLINAYRPYAMDLTSGPVYFESNSGRPTHVRFPYFNLEYGDGGVMLAIGWAGSWRADFRYDPENNTTTYTARSVNSLHTYLKPGEKIRTALFVKAPYNVRNENYATNYWRRWFIAHNLPSADGAGTPVKPFSTSCLASDTGLPNSDGSISENYTTWRPSLEKMIEEDVKVDFRWVDAGWYIAPNGNSPDGLTPENDWWSTIGTWELDPVKWPATTFRESTDFARNHGMKTLMWFEPERVCDPESLAKNYGYDEKWAIHGSANNIGDPECFAWTVGRIKKTLSENRVEMYREDNNRNPGELWHYLDELEGQDRSGITECKFIGAHYQMWDEIIACTTSYGGCGFVDSCASGGGRNDIESLRRGIPLLRSDFDRTSTAVRLSKTTSFNKWVPFCGAINKEKNAQLDATGVVDQYVWRASYLPVMNVDSQFVQDPDQDFEVLRTGLKEWKRLNTYLLDDFYVLTPWHSEEDNTGFTAYSFYNPEKKKGILLVFRQEKCVEDTLSLTLPYVETDELCTLTDEDSKKVILLDGKRMQKQGVEFVVEEARSAKLFWVDISSAK